MPNKDMPSNFSTYLDDTSYPVDLDLVDATRRYTLEEIATCAIERFEDRNTRWGTNEED